MLQLSYVLVYCALLAPYYAYAQSRPELTKPGECPKLPHPLPKPTFKDKITIVGIFTNIKSTTPGSAANLRQCEPGDFKKTEGHTLIGTDNKSYFLFYNCIEFNIQGKKTHLEIATALVVPKGPDPGTDKRFREALDKNKLGLKEWLPLCKV
ncbi:uncharacterized protein LOC115632976 [Scaptodrosophila lebanonensis]|uniref:Uncharacterized protein LOC115632976 n=1 Tax=Drosophila lebanonensis TaxID=7225 RepID=A0A6J2UGB2_DROLE|nr:uncharacterized protein LOC115632976 [Scaptodrosophila lebanonensis]